MERIYSRKRLKIPKTKKNIKFKLAFGFGILGLLLFVIGITISVYPIFEESCKSKAESFGLDITSQEVNKVMSNYDYDDLVDVQIGENGEIIMLKARIVPINKIISEVTLNIKNRIDSAGKLSVQINIGKLSGISFFSNVGPSFNMKVETLGRSKSRSYF